MDVVGFERLFVPLPRLATRTAAPGCHAVIHMHHVDLFLMLLAVRRMVARRLVLLGRCFFFIASAPSKCVFFLLCPSTQGRKVWFSGDVDYLLPGIIRGVKGKTLDVEDEDRRLHNVQASLCKVFISLLFK